MNFFELVSDFLGSLLTPSVLLASGMLLLPGVVTSGKQKKEKSVNIGNKKSSQYSALSMALAGTLGVGNITGVASALISGGSGAVFWMWAGALISVVVKYAEVYLAVKFRIPDKNGWQGGAMYYIRDGFSRFVSYKSASFLGGIFAVLCCLNSLLTGNIVQSNAAASIVPSDKRLICGIALGILLFISLLYGSRRIERITSFLMPPLTAVYMLVSVYIILVNCTLVPGILADIISSAFHGKAIVGGVYGFSVREAIRFGIMRGIFSNEAGCGTSPTAHAVAETNSPSSQAKLGMAEVVFDTVILCSMTALVLLIADSKYSLIPWNGNADASAVTLESFKALAGEGIYFVMIILVILFAYATIIAQLYYGVTAVRYLTSGKMPQYLYYASSVVCTIAGSVITAPVMWTAADLLIGCMTVMNCISLVILRKNLRA